MTGRIKAGEGTLIGNAGEYYVMAELLKRGMVAALAPRNAPSFDILATKEDRSVRIRVKTKSQGVLVWRFNAKKDGSIFTNISKEGDFTVLVDLAEETKDLNFYVVPTHQIETWLKKDFEEWVGTPGKKKPHNPKNTMRNLPHKKYAQDLNKYHNQWGKLWE